MKIRNIEEKIELIGDFIYCLEEIKEKLEELQDAEDQEEREDIKESIEDCLTEIDIDNKIIKWIKNYQKGDIE